MQYKIIEYKAPTGKIPYEQWLDGLRDNKAAAIIVMRAHRLALGNWGDYKTVGPGLYELRIDFGPGYRLYFSKIVHSVVILLCGGDKKSQQKDITRAQAYLEEFKKREKKN